MTNLPPLEWLTAPSTQKVIGALEAERADSARFVGGCVRNAVLGAPVSDIDIATQMTPDVVQRVLKAAGCAVHPTGIEHGTITVVADGDVFEVTTLRRDVETDGRRAVVAFTEDWSEDANRRDFTMNALYADRHGVVHDPTGLGLKHAVSRRIVFVGDPSTRIREDYLRILRFFRFQAWYGSGEPDPAGLAACAELANGLDQISAERIWVEVKKLLASPDPVPTLIAMQQAGVLTAILTHDRNIERLRGLLQVEADLARDPDPLLRLLALLGDDKDEITDVGRRMKASNEERARLKGAHLVSEPLAAYTATSDLRRIAYRCGATALIDRLMLMFADDRESAIDWKRAIGAVESWQRPELPVRGADVIAAGVPQGPRVGPIVAAVEEEWIASDFSLSRDELLARIAALATEA